jgi:hypothetical protein
MSISAKGLSILSMVDFNSFMGSGNKPKACAASWS